MQRAVADTLAISAEGIVCHMAGLSVLTELRKLHSLGVKDCSKLSEEAVNDLQSKLPALVDIQSGASPRECSIC